MADEGYDAVLAELSARLAKDPKFQAAMAPLREWMDSTCPTCGRRRVDRITEPEETARMVDEVKAANDRLAGLLRKRRSS